MNSRPKENVYGYYIIACIALFAVLAGAFWLAARAEGKKPFDPWDQYRKAFQISIPQSAATLLSEWAFGRDGHGLFIFKLTSEEMQAVLESLPKSAWYSLPLSSDAANGFRAADFAEPIAAYGGLSAKEGYYLFVEYANNQAAKRQNTNEGLRDYCFSIIDTKNNRIYFLIYHS